MEESELRQLIREEIVSAMKTGERRGSVNLTVLFTMGSDVDEERFNEWMDEVIEKGLVNVSFDTGPSKNDVAVVDVIVDNSEYVG